MADNEEARAWLEAVAAEVFPQMKGSAFALLPLVGELDGDPDPGLCLQIGAAIMMRKPLMIVVRKGDVLPPVLGSIASEIVWVDSDNPWTNAADQARIEQALREMARPV